MEVLAGSGMLNPPNSTGALGYDRNPRISRPSRSPWHDMTLVRLIARFRLQA